VTGFPRTAYGLAAFMALIVVACGNRAQTGAPSSTKASHGSARPGLLSDFGLTCRQKQWRVGFRLAAPAFVSVRVERSGSRQGGWVLVRALSSRLVNSGPHAVGGTAGKDGFYRVRLSFRASKGARGTRAIVFRGDCKRPLPGATPTLPGTTGTIPLQ